MILALKLILTPLLVGGSALAARRWGPSIGGWIISLPLTSGPVLAFLALDHGHAFATSAAVGSLAGLAAIGLFSIAYAWTAGRAGPIVSLLAAAAGFAGASLVLGQVTPFGIWVVFGVTLGVISLATWRIPASGQAHVDLPHPAWDIPARIVVATTIVVGLTTFAPLLGPTWSGMIATYPVYISVLTAFTHRHAGPAQARDVLAGTLVGLYGTAVFYVVVNLVLPIAGFVPAFGGALMTTLGISGLMLRRIRPTVELEPT